MSDNKNKTEVTVPAKATTNNSSIKSAGNTVAKVETRRDTQPQLTQDSDEALVMAKKAKQHKKWNRRLKIFFCCLGYKKNKVILQKFYYHII